ncbi:trypsin-like peptidase domain-containing protein [Glycomyces arizonensis]|uniref:trypsin-like peptidase domain-containing protein n=1 Tax=Glycomyces arizonensis TaxID=256035 RepID=UPI00047B298C|nr:trypsin-like peptidase domain-containing protein [Glycomyces arizonensis]
MSNIESNPRSEGGPEPSPERVRTTPDADPKPQTPGVEPTAQPETTPPAPGPAQSASEAPSGPPEPGSASQPGSALPPEPNHGSQPEHAPRPSQAQQPSHEQPTRVLPPGQHHAAPHMTAPHEAPPGWVPGGAVPPGRPPHYGPHGPGPQRRPKRGWGVILAGAVILALLAGGAGGLVGWYLSDDEPSTTVVESVSMDAGGGMTYTEIVDDVSPSVVTIVTDSAEGSGVVYSEDGYIVTNNHVVEGASAVQVRFPDGTVADAEVLATDPTQDLAVVQVSGVDDLQPIAFGDSDALQVGDATVAIGSPLGLEGTVTTGIVSALNRSMSVSNEEQSMGQSSGHTLSGLIQTDAAINMGNSGGALVNGNGELIGINTAILSPESGNVGLGFAIPSNTVKDVVEQLIEHGSVEQGYLGVSVTDTQGNGAMVLAVEAGSPADEAGLQEGDVITAVDGTQVASASEVVAAVQSKASGDTIGITYVRDNSEHDTEATLATR